MNPGIAVVIATYNRAGLLERVLENLRRQTLPREAWEVIVAVDGSTDGTEALLTRWTADRSMSIRYFFQPNAGQSVARHNGILRTSAERIVVIDDDMEICPEFLAEHLASSKRDPEKTVVIGKIVPESEFMRKPLCAAVVEHHLLMLHRRMEQGTQLPTATAFATANVSFPRALYLEVGGFDASLRLDEDRELGIRLERAGGFFVFAPGAWAIHHSDIGSFEKWSRRQYEYGKYAVQIWRKHERSPYLHPLRNFVNGSRLNRALVTLVCPKDQRADRVTVALRHVGDLLQRVDLLGPAVATHKAIQAVRYHQGVRDALGSWGALRTSEQEFLSDPERPRGPTGVGITNAGAARSNGQRETASTVLRGRQS
jgi:glycosyltransferase involved in cell wall biosynthesis